MRLTCSLLLLATTCFACSSAKAPGTSTDTSGATDSGSLSDTGSTTDDAALLDYPAPPYGLTVGYVFPPRVLMGYPQGSTSWSSIALKQYYDPDGSKGVHGLYVSVGALFCAACKAEASTLPGEYNSSLKARGARILGVLAADASQSTPSTQATADAWNSAYHITYDLVIDPTFTTLRIDDTGSFSVGLPLNYTIDPRSMRITAVTSGPFWTPGSSALDAVLKKNGH